MEGLSDKYVISKSDGSPIDPDAVYFVLRIDAGSESEACRAALAVFARRCKNRNLADDVNKLLAQFDSPFYGEDLYRPTVRRDWTLPECKICPECGVEMYPVAVDVGDEWILIWDCENGCTTESANEIPIDWPFHEDGASAIDLEAVGFTIA